jgi:hypothetical protein
VPLKKILLKPGVNKENTRYTNENGWYISDKVRFRQGTPEKIGGWARISANTFQGVCRALWNWVTLGFQNLLGVGTNLKYYIERGGEYIDVTPIRTTVTLGTDPFAGNGTTTVTVTANSHGALTGDFVTFSGSTDTLGPGGTSLFDAEYQLTVVNANSYTITTASSVAAGSYGGSAVVAAYQINVGPEIEVPLSGWGGGGWGLGTWGFGVTGSVALRLWSANNFGEDLVFGPRGGALYYWDAGNLSTNPVGRAVNANTIGGSVTFDTAETNYLTLSNLLAEGTAIKFETSGSMPSPLVAGTTYYLLNVDGATAQLSATLAGSKIVVTTNGSGVYISELVDVPTIQNYILVSDTSRFVLLFGTTDYGSTTLDPMLVRWSNQESVVDWVPSSLNQAGSVRLSHGSEIVTALQTRQEIVVWTDSSLYSLQYVGAPVVWASQLLGDNISIVGQNAAAVASGIVYWMGVDKFYRYDGRVQTLRCDLRRHVFSNINTSQYLQVFAGTNEGFNEVWWFYCSAGSNVVDSYVVYNYAEDVWYYGSLGRTAWIDSGLRDYPVAATYNYNLVNHEQGIDDNATETPTAIDAYIESAEFDIDDGEHFGFVWRMVPDLTFQGSTTASPQVTMTMYGMNGSGSGFNTEASKAVARTSTVTIEQFTNIVYTRIRGRQMIMKIGSSGLGTTWQLGAPRIDIKPDGRR